MAAKRRRAGLGLLEAVIGAVLLTLGLVLTAQLAADWWRQRQVEAVGGQTRQMVEAARAYLRANRAELWAATAAGPAVVTPAMLRATGALPTGASDNNLWRQSYQTLFRRDGQAVVGLVVTTGGAALDDVTASAVAMAAAPEGGYVAAALPGVAQGASWQADLSSYTAGTGVAPTPGHLAASLAVGDAAALSAALQRDAMPGFPDLNRMTTTLDMGGQPVANAGLVSAADVAVGSRGRTAAQGVYDVVLVDSGDSISKPTCPAGTTPGVYLAFARLAADAQGSVWSAAQTQAIDAGATWQVRLRLRTYSGWVEPPAGVAQALAVVKCD